MAQVTIFRTRGENGGGHRWMPHEPLRSRPGSQGQHRM